MAIVTMRYWAAAKEAAGVAEEVITADTLAGALATIRSRRGGGGPVRSATAAGGGKLGRVLDRSSFLVDGDPVGRRAADGVVLADGAIIEVLPPFAGG